jgi:hypothetical protein
MARRRVFETKVECPGISINLGLTANRLAIVGRVVTLEKSGAASEVNVRLEGTVVGRLDDVVGPQVASAMDHGQAFTATIKNAYQNYDEKFKPNTALLYLKVAYLLEKGQQAIKIPRPPIQPIESSPTARSFFTKVAGVTFEGRQRIIARCSVGEHLTLLRDPTNWFDRGAIKVMRLTGEQLGFIPADVSRGGDASGLASQMDQGTEYRCRISDITGGTDGRSLGVNLEVTQGEDFDAVLSATTNPALSSATPTRSNFGWLLFAALTVVLVILAFVIHNLS